MEFSPLQSAFQHVVQAAPVLLLLVLLLVVASQVFVRTLSFDPGEELVEKRNLAFGIVLAAFLASVGIALTGTLFLVRQDPSLGALGEAAIEGLVAIVLLRLSILVNDKLILSRFCIVKELKEDRNLGTAFCVAGSSLAGGVILSGALTGFSTSFGTGLRDIVIYWLIAQVLLVVGGLIHAQLARYDVHRLIEFDDNAAVGLDFGGYLLGIGIVLRAAIVGADMNANAGAEVLGSGTLAVLGLVIFSLLNHVVHLGILPRMSKDEEVEMNGNLAVSAVAFCATLALALLVGAAIQR